MAHKNNIPSDDDKNNEDRKGDAFEPEASAENIDFDPAKLEANGPGDSPTPAGRPRYHGRNGWQSLDAVSNRKAKIHHSRTEAYLCLSGRLRFDRLLRSTMGKAWQRRAAGDDVLYCQGDSRRSVVRP